jgi:hypothetical protein
MSDEKHDGEPGWFERRENQNRLFYGLLVVAAALMAAELVFGLHPHFDIERIPWFYALFGFLAFVVIVFAGLLLRTVIMRDEDYYDRR